MSLSKADNWTSFLIIIVLYINSHTHTTNHTYIQYTSTHSHIHTYTLTHTYIQHTHVHTQTNCNINQHYTSLTGTKHTSFAMTALIYRQTHAQCQWPRPCYSRCPPPPPPWPLSQQTTLWNLRILNCSSYSLSLLSLLACSCSNRDRVSSSGHSATEKKSTVQIKQWPN